MGLPVWREPPSSESRKSPEPSRSARTIQRQRSVRLRRSPVSVRAPQSQSGSRSRSRHSGLWHPTIYHPTSPPRSPRPPPSSYVHPLARQVAVDEQADTNDTSAIWRELAADAGDRRHSTLLREARRAVDTYPTSQDGGGDTLSPQNGVTLEDVIHRRLVMTNQILRAARTDYLEQIQPFLSPEQQNAIIRRRDRDADSAFIQSVRTLRRFSRVDLDTSSATSSQELVFPGIPEPPLSPPSDLPTPPESLVDMMQMQSSDPSHPNVQYFQHPGLPTYSPELEFVRYMSIYSGPTHTEFQSLTPGFAPSQHARIPSPLPRPSSASRPDSPPSRASRSISPVNQPLPAIASLVSLEALGYTSAGRRAINTSRQQRSSRRPRRHASSHADPPPLTRSASFDGLGDRERSPPTLDDPWATMQTTIPPDAHAASASSSFTSAMASASASQLGSNVASSTTSLTDGAAPSANSSRDASAEYEEALRAAEAATETAHECDDESTTDSEEEDMSFIASRPPLTSGHDYGNYSTLWSLRANRPPATTSRAVRNADLEPVASGDDLDGMQRIVARLAQRSDIPDDWWAGAGLQRHLPRRSD